MGWLYDGKPNRLVKVFFKSAGQPGDLSDFGGISPLDQGLAGRVIRLNDGEPRRFRVDVRRHRGPGCEDTGPMRYSFRRTDPCRSGVVEGRLAQW